MASSQIARAGGTAIARSNSPRAGDDVVSFTDDTTILISPRRPSISLDQMTNDLGEDAKTLSPIYSDFSASIDTNKPSVAREDPAGAKLCPMPPRACELGVSTTVIGLDGNSFDAGALAGIIPWLAIASHSHLISFEWRLRRALTRPADVKCFA
ncbi:hypothetical protein ACFSQT_10925 [Mesorhizobium calcicola]|uniref:Uncharacterized protein n=1 Tax=Mesorhizobium calcicola TaxID=1300310 RepID=A0ABW4WAC2_9HYPH